MNYVIDELKTWYTTFKGACPDGKLDKKQFNTVFQEVFAKSWFKQNPEGNVEAFCKHLFRAFDINQDRSIDFQEFVHAIDLYCHGTKAEKLEWFFRMYDVNLDGTIQREEMKLVLESIYEINGGNKEMLNKHAKKIFDKMDTDGDNLVTLEEFKETVLRNHSSIL